MLNITQKVSAVVLLGLSLSAVSAQPENSAPQHSQTCPTDFYALPIIPEPKFCQQFSTDLPASLSYHVARDQQSAANYYLEKVGQAESQQTSKGRIVLQYQGGQKIVIISVDGQGSQIDILVKSIS